MEEEGGEGANEATSPPRRVPTPVSAPIPIPGQEQQQKQQLIAAPAVVAEGGGGGGAGVGAKRSVRFREVEPEEGKGDVDVGGEAGGGVAARGGELVVGSSEGLSGEFTPSYAAYTPSARVMHDLR